MPVNFHAKQKNICWEPPITFQAEPNILPFDPGDSCHMDILRWQRVDGLQFHALFEAVVILILAEKTGSKQQPVRAIPPLFTHTEHRSTSMCLPSVKESMITGMTYNCSILSHNRRSCDEYCCDGVEWDKTNSIPCKNK